MEILEQIAKKHLLINDCKVKNSDSLDFHDLYIGNIMAALKAAYEAGLEHGKKHD